MKIDYGVILLLCCLEICSWKNAEAPVSPSAYPRVAGGPVCVCVLIVEHSEKEEWTAINIHASGLAVYVFSSPVFLLEPVGSCGFNGCCSQGDVVCQALIMICWRGGAVSSVKIVCHHQQSRVLSRSVHIFHCGLNQKSPGDLYSRTVPFSTLPSWKRFFASTCSSLFMWCWTVDVC